MSLKNSLTGNIIIRQETSSDYRRVYKLVKDAFQDEVFSDHQEHYLVERLRKSEAFIAELSLVAEVQKHIIGYILLTRIEIAGRGKTHESLALAPVVVDREYRNSGIGAQLIRRAHSTAKDLGFQSVILLGMPVIIPGSDTSRAVPTASVCPSWHPRKIAWRLSWLKMLYVRQAAW